MTIREAIELSDSLRPDQYSRELKIRWLSKLDAQVYIEIFRTHESCPVDGFAGYDGESGQDTALLIPEPYAQDVYPYYLQSCADCANGEAERYNQSVTLYNNAFLTFQNYWNRCHTPMGGGAFRF